MDKIEEGLRQSESRNVVPDEELENTFQNGSFKLDSPGPLTI